MSVNNLNNIFNSSTQNQIELGKGKISVNQQKISSILPLDDQPFSPVTSTSTVHFEAKPLSNLLKSELDQDLNVQENEIEKKLKEIENQKEQPSLDILEEIKNINSTLGFTSESIEKGMDFLESTLPSNLLKQLPLHKESRQIKEIFSVGTQLLSALDTGLQGLILIYKNQILERSRNLLKEFKEHYLPTFHQEHSSEIRNKILEWETQILLEERKLGEEGTQFFLDTTSKVFPPVEVIAKGHELGIIEKESKDLHKWIKSYNRENRQLTIAIDEHKHLPPNNITDIGQKLLAKRTNIREEKVQWLCQEQQFDIFENKIKDFHKSRFVRNMQELLWGSLQNSECTPLEIKKIFDQWKISDLEMNSQNKQLMDAFEQFQNTKEPNESNKTKISSEEQELKQQNLMQELSRWMGDPTFMDQQFEHWFETNKTQNKEELARSYIDHQETLEITTKNALKQMVRQKQTLESRFHQLKLTKSRIQFSVATISLAITAAITILGLLSISLGGVGLILLAISMGSAAISLGLWGASYAQSYYYKPHATQTLTFFFQAKMAWTRLRTSIQAYSHQTKEKKLKEVAQILDMHLSKKTNKNNLKYQKALDTYKKAQLDFEESQQKVNDWTKQLDDMETHLAKETWKDFAEYASLQNPEMFDTLRAFQEALEACDLSLLSPETRHLLEVHLGVNLETLQAQIEQEPEGIKNTLQEFFVLDDAGLINFIRNQKARINKGLLQPQIA